MKASSISCGEMGISDSTYRRIKHEAVNMLAGALKLAVILEKYSSCF